MKTFVKYDGSAYPQRREVSSTEHPFRIYVQSATWQGKNLNECKLTHSQITEGGELHFVMGDKPSDWAK